MSDWSEQAADLVEKTVIAVRDKTVVPAQRASKAVVYGVLVGFVALVVGILLSILVFRVLDIFLPTWAAWLVLGGIFLLAGALCWARRNRIAPESPVA